jgi:HEAT repeat protein
VERDPIIIECIERLYSKKLSLLDKDKKGKVNALRYIASHGEISDIRSIYPLILTFDKPLSSEVIATIDSLVSKLKDREWVNFYESVRYIDLYPKQIKLLQYYASNDRANILGVASLNAVGQVRQAALKEMALLQDGRIVPYVILRLADWVERVREEAHKIFAKLLGPQYIPYFLDCCYLLKWMEGVRRVDLSFTRSKIVDYLTNHVSLINFEKELRANCPLKRRLLYELLLKKGLDTDLIHLVRNDSNPAIRFWFVRKLIKSDFAGKEPLLLEFLDDSFTKTQLTIMRYVNDGNWLLYEDKIKEKLCSNSFSVRYLARFILKGKNYSCYSEYLRDAIKCTSKIKVGHILGLAETGSEEDIFFIKDYITHTSAKYRQAVYTGLYCLDKIKAVPYLIDGLDDHSGKVRRKCRELLHEIDEIEVFQEVRNRIASYSINGQIDALQFLCFKYSWDSLIDILKVLIVGHPKVKDVAWDELKKCIARRSVRLWAKPSKDQLEKIEVLIEVEYDVGPEQRACWNELICLIRDGKKFWN